MNSTQLLGQMVSVKIEGVDTVISAVILGVESVGLWIHKGDVLEKIDACENGARSQVLKEPAVFLPFARIFWLITETKEPVYQKAR